MNWKGKERSGHFLIDNGSDNGSSHTGCDMVLMVMMMVVNEIGDHGCGDGNNSCTDSDSSVDSHNGHGSGAPDDDNGCGDDGRGDCSDDLW
jgi:hypothetical protein